MGPQHHVFCVLVILVVVLDVTQAAWPSEVPFWPRYPLRSATRSIHVLDGEWEFAYHAHFAGDITSTTINTTQIATPNRTHVPGSFDYVAPGYEGVRGTAFFRTRVDITPRTRALINFNACSFYCNVYVDNVAIGDHRAGGYSPFWLSIPPSPTQTRTIFVVVDNRWNATTAPVHTGGDFYHVGGIHRSVIVHQLPNVTSLYIERVEVLPRNPLGVVDITVVLPNNYNGPVTLSVNWDLRTNDSTRFEATSKNGAVTLLNVKVPDARPWTLESPNLHHVYIGLVEKNQVYDDIYVRFGLRIISEDKNHRLTINGAVVKLRGHNRHTEHPDVGPSLTLGQIETDIRILRDLGANYVRGAHYPQDQRFLDLADEAGIAIWEEALGPAVTTKNTQDAYFMKYQIIQMNEMISASINHPSVILWGFFNEGPSDDGGSCPGYKACAEAARGRDNTRYATWANNHGLSDKCLQYAGVISFNAYPGWYDHGGNSTYPITYWTDLITNAAKSYNQPFTVSETGCEGLYEWVNSSTTLWGQSYQNVVMTNNIKTILGSPRVSGLAIWVMNDFKGNDDAQSTCGPCHYISGTHNATNINVGCNGKCGLGCRPCGENHKGALDYWRREKQVYGITKTLFHAQWP